MAVFRRSAAGAPVRVAIIGRYGFTGEAFADTAAQVIAGERAFWKDRERPFLVALAPLTPELTGLSARGEGRAGAFAVQTTTNFGLDGLTTLVGHEYFHTWNADRLGGIDEGEREPASYWFSEGFTEFYARRLLLRSIVWNRGARRGQRCPIRAESRTGCTLSPSRRELPAFATTMSPSRSPSRISVLVSE